MGYFGIPFRNGVPIGLGSVVGFGAPQEFSPSELFLGGTAGAWYDPSDLTTLFTTSAGTTQCAMPGGGSAVVVGRMLDKSGNGNHAIAFNDTTARPELRARVNLLTYSEEFDNGAWTKNNATVANTSATTDPLGGASADLIYPNITGACRLYQAASGISSVYNATIYVKYAGVQWVRIYSADNASSAWFDVQNGVVGTVNPGVTAPTPTAVVNGWYRLSVAKTSAALFFQIDLVDGNNSTTVTAAGTNGVYIWGADLRPANIGANVPAYQRIADANTYDTSGFPLYLRFDGIDDSMYTPANLNLSGTDKVAVFAGVRKLSDAADAVIVELSNNFNSAIGAFLVNYVATGVKTAAALKGNIGYSSGEFTDSAAPISEVLSTLMDMGLSTNEISFINKNGVAQILTRTNNANNTGNYGTYPLYIGSRNNSSIWFNGHLHSLIIAGSAVSAGNISATEQWVAGKTGIVIP